MYYTNKEKLSYLRAQAAELGMTFKQDEKTGYYKLIDRKTKETLSNLFSLDYAFYNQINNYFFDNYK